jgi:DNA-binding response OmpR family regulator
MRLLIVEDDEILNKNLKASLEKSGYAVDNFTHAEKAERHILVNHSNYDVFIFDYMLPDKNGIELCITVRQNEILTPIIMLTSVSEKEKIIAALDVGADDYLTKPFSVDELKARVRALLRRPRAARSDTISIRDLMLNVSTQEVLVNNQPVKLTLKEFGILEYLMRNPDTVVSRDQLLDHVWDFQANAFSNIVDVHVTNLRKKLEQAGAKSILQTVRGVGFKIKSK